MKIISKIKQIRNLYLSKIRWGKYKIGMNFHAGRNVLMWAKNSIVIRDNFYIGKFSLTVTNAKIGNNVILANFVSFIGWYDHHY